MKTHFIGAGILLLVGSSGAIAQDIVIAPEQQTVIREYVQKEPLASIDLPGFHVQLGEALPDEVELRSIPDVQYQYVVIDNQTALVDPGTRKIIQVIE